MPPQPPLFQKVRLCLEPPPTQRQFRIVQQRLLCRARNDIWLMCWHAGASLLRRAKPSVSKNSIGDAAAELKQSQAMEQDLLRSAIPLLASHAERKAN